MDENDKITIKDVLESTMTVGELRHLLFTMDDKSPVVFSSDFGDHGHTQQIRTVQEDDLASFDANNSFRVSVYSKTGVAFNGEYDDDDGECDDGVGLNPPKVMVISL